MLENVSYDIFLKRVGLHRDIISLPDDIKLTNEYLSSDFWNDKKNEDIYDRYIKEIAIKNSQEQFVLFKKYFKTNVMSGEVAIVDIGWRGSMH